MRRRAAAAMAAFILGTFVLSACAPGGPTPPAASPGASATARATPPVAPSPVPAVAATPDLPPYYVDALRRRAYAGGDLLLGAQMFRGDGFTKYRMSWPSGGAQMTGTISIPDGEGPFPVLVVNHGFIPPGRYWVGQDSGIFGDPLAAHGFLFAAPDWPGYAGSGEAAPGVPALVAEMIATLDLVSSLERFPRADISRLALAGHSNGGGITLLASVVDPRIRVTVLFAPVSSDMADNARKWWGANGSAGAAGTPEQNPSGYAAMSPRNFFARGQPPALFLQGTADHDIPAAWTQATVDAMRTAGVRAEVTWFPGADHDLVGADLARAVELEESWIREALGR